MKRYLFLTDTHFNFANKSPLRDPAKHLSKKQGIEFLLDVRETIQQQQLDGLFLSGDVINGPNVEKHLLWISKILQIPIYFVRGNHENYFSNFKNIQSQISQACQQDSNLHYLDHCQPISLSENTALIGHTGWYDAGYRKPLTPLVFIWDFLFIEDFRKCSSMADRYRLMRQKANEAARILGKKLLEALETHQEVILVTHWPPWVEHSGSFIGNHFWKPYNASRVLAETLENIMWSFPNKKLTVLAGHSHNAREEQITSNICLKVGGSARDTLKMDSIILVE